MLERHENENEGRCKSVTRTTRGDEGMGSLVRIDGMFMSEVYSTPCSPDEEQRAVINMGKEERRMAGISMSEAKTPRYHARVRGADISI